MNKLRDGRGISPTGRVYLLLAADKVWLVRWRITTRLWTRGLHAIVSGPKGRMASWNMALVGSKDTGRGESTKDNECEVTHGGIGTHRNTTAVTDTHTNTCVLQCSPHLYPLVVASVYTAVAIATAPTVCHSMQKHTHNSKQLFCNWRTRCRTRPTVTKSDPDKPLLPCLVTPRLVTTGSYETLHCSTV